MWKINIINRRTPDPAVNEIVADVKISLRFVPGKIASVSFKI